MFYVNPPPAWGSRQPGCSHCEDAGRGPGLRQRCMNTSPAPLGDGQAGWHVLIALSAGSGRSLGSLHWEIEAELVCQSSPLHTAHTERTSAPVLRLVSDGGVCCSCSPHAEGDSSFVNITDWFIFTCRSNTDSLLHHFLLDIWRWWHNAALNAQCISL